MAWWWCGQYCTTVKKKNTTKNVHAPGDLCFKNRDDTVHIHNGWSEDEFAAKQCSWDTDAFSSIFHLVFKISWAWYGTPYFYILLVASKVVCKALTSHKLWEISFLIIKPVIALLIYWIIFSFRSSLKLCCVSVSHNPVSLSITQKMKMPFKWHK